MAAKETGMTYPEGPKPMDIPEDRHGNPRQDSVCYLDSENSILCAYCALESNNYDEVPQFRPVKTAEPAEGEQCDHCSKNLA